LKDLDISAGPAASPASFEQVEDAWQWVSKQMEALRQNA